jgi:ubiquinone biosynthesis UbiH/UbiF/VisC/COQ6 family hydroxylase
MRIFGDRSSLLEFDAYQAGVPELAWIVEDRVLQDALWQGLDVPVHRSACQQMHLDPEEVSLTLDVRLSAKLVIGADGANSFVRNSAGISVTEKSYGQIAVVANFRCERPHANVAYQWFQRGAVLALLPLPGNHVSMVWSTPNAPGENIADEVERASGGVLGKLSLVTPPRSYPLRRLAAERMVSPRVALAGDAAHVIHPLAGQGLNLGLQDARELARVLMEREPSRDPGELGLLRRYERSRAEPILAMDMMVDTLFRLFGAESDFLAVLRNAGLNFTDRLPVVKNMLIRQAIH